jgi:catalase-peroxidase
MEEMGFGWKNSFGTGNGSQTISSGLEGAWTPTPKSWDNSYFETLFEHEWVQTKSPGGATQWIPKDGASVTAVPDAHDSTKSHAPVMLTTDLALRIDPIYEPISRRFYEHPDELADAFARAWFKLTHRDMGPISRYLGALVPTEQLIWQDPIPEATHKLIDSSDIDLLKKKLLESGLSISQLVAVAWASASTFRGTDKRGGANGARIRLKPQRDWEANNPDELTKVLTELERIQGEFNSSVASIGKGVSLADLIVLAGCAAVEQGAKNAGHDLSVAFVPGRTDATQEQTDVDSFAVLEPDTDGFRNFRKEDQKRLAEYSLVERASMLTLTIPEMTVLVGGMRVLNANYAHSQVGVLTKKVETLSNDFFVNLLDVNLTWHPIAAAVDLFEARDRDSGEVKWTGSRADLVFGSNSQLRAVAEVYASADAEAKFTHDFISAWEKVMALDRFDLT